MIDAIRRAAWIAPSEALDELEAPVVAADRDEDLLKMMFVCCHPAIPLESALALALRTLCGFPVPALSRALRLDEAAVEKRLTRARQVLREEQVEFDLDGVPDAELAVRLDGVLRTLYVLFLEGYSAHAGDTQIDGGLCGTAIRLNAMLLASRFKTPRGHALHALFLLQTARLASIADSFMGSIMRGAGIVGEHAMHATYRLVLRHARGDSEGEVGTRKKMGNPESAFEGPATLIFVRKVKPGREAAYKAWVAGFQEASRQVKGFLGASTMARGQEGPEYISIVRFDTFVSLNEWEASDLRTDWLRRLPADTVEGDAEVRRLEGVEFWFTPPGVAPAAAPSTHKMALVLVVVVFGLVSVMTPVARVVLGDAPMIVRTLTMVVGQVILMTYVIMPRVTRLLATWLFRR